MKQQIGFEIPFNTTSFGNLGILIAKTLYSRQKNGDFTDLDIYISPIGGVDLSANNDDPIFNTWLNDKILKGLTSWNRNYKSFKLWHLNGSMNNWSNHTTLLSFFETDKPTATELNVVRNNKTCFSSNYTCNIFKSLSVDCHYLPLAFDSFNYHRIDKKFFPDNRIPFLLTGKYEARKAHSQIIKAWVKKFGGNSKYILMANLYNPFLVQQTPQGIIDHNNRFIAEALEGKEKPYNFTLYPPFQKNQQFNEFINANSIVIAMSRSENWGLGEFNATCMGKTPICLDAHGYKEWADDKNAVLVKPNGKSSSVDGVHFSPNPHWNQGDFFSWDSDEFIAACEQAIKRVESNPVNTEGLKLQEKFSADKFVDNILKLALE